MLTQKQTPLQFSSRASRSRQVAIVQASPLQHLLRLPAPSFLRRLFLLLFAHQKRPVQTCNQKHKQQQHLLKNRRRPTTTHLSRIPFLHSVHLFPPEALDCKDPARLTHRASSALACFCLSAKPGAHTRPVPRRRASFFILPQLHAHHLLLRLLPVRCRQLRAPALFVRAAPKTPSCYAAATSRRIPAPLSMRPLQQQPRASTSRRLVSISSPASSTTKTRKKIPRRRTPPSIFSASPAHTSTRASRTSSPATPIGNETSAKEWKSELYSAPFNPSPSKRSTRCR